MVNKLPQEAQLVLSSMKLREEGKLIESMDIAINGLASYPDDIQLMQVTAEGYVALGLFYRALGIYEKLQKLGKLENEDEFNLSSTYLSMNMFVKAQNFALKFLKRYPDNFEVLFQAGNTYERMNMLPTALSYFEKSYNLNKSFQRSQLGKIRCLTKLCRTEELEQEVFRLTDVKIKAETRKFLRFVESIQGTEVSRAKDELIIFQQLIKSDDITEIAEIWFNKGIEYNKTGKNLQATIALGRAKLYRPDYYHYEVVYNELATPPQSEEDFFKVQYIEGRLTDNANERLFGRAATKIPMFDPHRFVPTRKSRDRYALTELGDVNPQILQQIDLVKGLMERNRFHTALLILDLILRDEPDFGIALLFKGIVLKMLGKYEEAASIVFQYMSLRVEEPVIIKLGIEIFTKLALRDHAEYYATLLKELDPSKVQETHNRSILGYNSSMRTTQTSMIKRNTKKIVDRYALPRNTWNMAMHGYLQLSQGIVDGIVEMTYSLLPEIEPNYIEGRIAEATYWMMKKNLQKAEEVITYVLTLSPQYESALIKQKELEGLKNGEKVNITKPIMEHNTYLSTFYYQKYFFEGRHISQNKSNLSMKCSNCGQPKKTNNQNFCIKCGYKF